MTEFAGLELAQPLLRAISDEGYTAPTPIQAKAIPPLLDGRDLLGVAQTGTGKTAAFALPLLHRLLKAHGKGPCALVLAPTRELATQIAKETQTLAKFTRIKTVTIYGGVSMRHQVSALRQQPEIVVGCPGRVLDLFQQGILHLDRIEALVLDEADHMLDMGFLPQIRAILERMPEDRQMAFFSATMPKQIKELVSQYCRNPAQVSVTPESTTAERIEQFLFMVQQDEKQSLLELILSGRHEIPGKLERVLVFARTKHGCDRVVKKLAQVNIAANAIHGNKSQPQREAAMRAFRDVVEELLGQIPPGAAVTITGSYITPFDFPELRLTSADDLVVTGSEDIPSATPVSGSDIVAAGIVRALNVEDGQVRFVLEIDPARGDIVWTYSGTPLDTFYSSRISGAQRLVNGNTFICEGRHGRLFEVTSDGDIVWEFVSPHQNVRSDGITRQIFRSLRYGADSSEIGGRLKQTV